MTVSKPGDAELAAMARRGARFLAREQVFNGEYQKAGEFSEWRIEHGPITKIMPSDGCKGDTVPLVVGR